jgi:RimJ/RimL family protein N-acetyltransferase
MNINGNSVLLRAIEKEDLKSLHLWANNESIQLMLGGWHFPTNMNDQNKWFETLSCNSLNQRFIVENETNKSIGMANIVNINFKDGNAEIGLLLDPEFQGQGYGKKIIDAISDYSFYQLRLNRLETTIISINQPSLKLFLNKCGWKQEGILRNWYYRNGIYIDKIILSILKEEYIK